MSAFPRVHSHTAWVLDPLSMLAKSDMVALELSIDERSMTWNSCVSGIPYLPLFALRAHVRERLSICVSCANKASRMEADGCVYARRDRNK